MLVGAFFLDKSHATHRWIKLRSGGHSAFRDRQARRHPLSGVVPGPQAPQRRKMEFSKEDFLHNILPADRADTRLRGVDSGAAGPRYFRGHRSSSPPPCCSSPACPGNGLLSAQPAALPALYLLIMHVAYRQARMMAFLHPDSGPAGCGLPIAAVSDCRRIRRIHAASA